MPGQFAILLILLMQAISTRTSQLPDTAAWLLAATLLLSLLGLGSLARPAAPRPQPQLTTRPTPANSAQIVPSSWRPSVP